MELTKEEKHKLYSQCLYDIESGKHIYCCSSLHERLDSKLNTMIFCGIVSRVFSELYELKCDTSKYTFGSWFSTRDKRIEALKKCIELTK